MSDLLRPGDHRAEETFSDDELLVALHGVEQAWAGRAHLPSPSPEDLDPTDVEASGNPVVPLVRWLREHTGDDTLHRGLTSQDVLDTALMLLARDAVRRIDHRLRGVVQDVSHLAEVHRDTRMTARTLGQPAVPTTFGLKAATWAEGLLDAWEDLAALEFPVQLGGAGGTASGVVAVGRDPLAETARLARDLGLAEARPWHTGRRPVTRIGDALVAVVDACGRVANDVVVLSRPEIGELAEGSPGGSSTMPHKQNPVLSVLVRAAALRAPGLGATLHLAAAGQVDERADGAWHAEWPTLRDLARTTLVATAQTADLLAGLRVHPGRMAAHLDAVADDVLAEWRSLAGDAGADADVGRPEDHLGVAGALVDRTVARADRLLEELW